jgi:hypothetical protein
MGYEHNYEMDGRDLEVVKAYYQNYNSICLQELEKKNEKHQ